MPGAGDGMLTRLTAVHAAEVRLCDFYGLLIWKISRRKCSEIYYNLSGNLQKVLESVKVFHSEP